MPYPKWRRNWPSSLPQMEVSSPRVPLPPLYQLEMLSLIIIITIIMSNTPRLLQLRDKIRPWLSMHLNREVLLAVVVRAPQVVIRVALALGPDLPQLRHKDVIPAKLHRKVHFSCQWKVLQRLLRYLPP